MYYNLIYNFYFIYSNNLDTQSLVFIKEGL